MMDWRSMSTFFLSSVLPFTVQIGTDSPDSHLQFVTQCITLWAVCLWSWTHLWTGNIAITSSVYLQRDGSYLLLLLTCLFVFVHLITDEDQETSGDFGSGGAVILLDDQEEEPSQSGRSRQKKRRGRIHPRGAIEDDEDEEDDKDDEIGYVW